VLLNAEVIHMVIFPVNFKPFHVPNSALYANGCYLKIPSIRE